jgi:hypothetical protein
MAREHLQQQELRERELALAAPRLVRAQVQAHVLEGERLPRPVLLLAGAAQQRAHAREQLAQRERLDEVVVRARVQAGDAVVDLAARGEHQNGRAVAALAQAPAHLQPIHVRHRDVEDHHVVGAGAEPLQRLAAVDGLGDIVVFQRQRPGQRTLHGGLVVYNQYVRLLGHRLCGSHAAPGCSPRRRGRRGGPACEASVTGNAETGIRKSEEDAKNG